MCVVLLSGSRIARTRSGCEPAIFKRSPGRLIGRDREGSIEELQYPAGRVIRYAERLQDELLPRLLGLEPRRRFIHVCVDET